LNRLHPIFEKKWVEHNPTCANKSNETNSTQIWQQRGVVLGCFALFRAWKNEGMKTPKQHFKKLKSENRGKNRNVFKKVQISKIQKIVETSLFPGHCHRLLAHAGCRRGIFAVFFTVSGAEKRWARHVQAGAAEG